MAVFRLLSEKSPLKIHSRFSVANFTHFRTDKIVKPKSTKSFFGSDVPMGPTALLISELHVTFESRICKNVLFHVFGIIKENFM